MLNHDVTFNLGSAKVCSPVIFQTYFSDDRDMWIFLTDFYMYCYLMVLLSDNCSSFNKF